MLQQQTITTKKLQQNIYVPFESDNQEEKVGGNKRESETVRQYTGIIVCGGDFFRSISTDILYELVFYSHAYPNSY